MSDSGSAHVELGLAVVAKSQHDAAGLLHIQLLAPRSTVAHRIQFVQGTAIVYGADSALSAVLIASLVHPQFTNLLDSTLLTVEEQATAMESRDSMDNPPEPS